MFYDVLIDALYHKVIGTIIWPTYISKIISLTSSVSSSYAHTWYAYCTWGITVGILEIQRKVERNSKKVSTFK